MIVKDHTIIGTGHTLPAGQSHAEICALKEAGKNAENATLYTTLEPCAHFGKTPPCTQAIIDAKIKEVVIAVEDPDIRVQGKGIKILEKAGIKVLLGICKKEASECLSPYLYQRTTELPFTVLKAAISMDGRTAAEDGSSQWITSEEARNDAHLLEMNLRLF